MKNKEAWVKVNKALRKMNEEDETKTKLRGTRQTKRNEVDEQGFRSK